MTEVPSKHPYERIDFGNLEDPLIRQLLEWQTSPEPLQAGALEFAHYQCRIRSEVEELIAGIKTGEDDERLIVNHDSYRLYIIHREQQRMLESWQFRLREGFWNFIDVAGSYLLWFSIKDHICSPVREKCKKILESLARHL